MYVRGMGQACDPGYQPSADGTVCEQTVTLGDTCMSSSFPWIGSIAPGGACKPVDPILVWLTIGVATVVFLGER